jgi:type I restriction enzyme, S subunit
MSPWRRSSIGELCDEGLIELQTGPFGSQLHAHDYVPRGVPVVPTEALRGRRINHSVLPQITTEKANTLERHRLKLGDILFARRGAQATGQTGFVRNEEVGFICGTGAIRLRVIDGQSHKILPEFLSHVFADAASVAWFKFHAIGATMPNLNEGIIRSFSLLLPPFEDQRAIADLLTALDDKIELNRRMNETLEATGRAIFKSRFEGSIGSGAPGDWTESTLDSVLAVIETGGRPKGGVSTYGSGIPSIGAESIQGLATFDFSKTKYVPHDYYESMKKGRLHDRDVLLYKDGGRPGQFEPHVALFGDGFPFEKASINEHVYRLRANSHLSQSLLYFWLTSDSCVEEMRNKGTGVAVPGLNSTAVKSLRIILPPEPTVKALDAVLEPLIAAALNNAKQSNTLAGLRDALLPSLISGELRIKDAQKTVEATA